MPDHRLTLDRLEFAYPAAAPLLWAISAEALSGRLTAILGPNGSGKTTLMRLMLGQLRPTGGRVLLGGCSVAALSERERACQVAYVPQHTAPAFAHSLGEVVAMGTWPAGRPRADAEAEIAAWGLGELQEASWPRLSGGERQRGLLARACCQGLARGRALLVDEPTASMDPAWAHRTLRMLRSRARDRRLAVVAVLHDLDLAMRYADDAWLLADGGLIAAGPVEEVALPAQLEQAYGVRFTQIALEHGRSTALADPVD